MVIDFGWVGPERARPMAYPQYQKNPVSKYSPLRLDDEEHFKDAHEDKCRRDFMITPTAASMGLAHAGRPVKHRWHTNAQK